jgi:uncharacterized protein (TIGR03083 family)
MGIRLDSTVPISVLEPLRIVNSALLDLLNDFTIEDWRKPTVHKDRDVKDLTAHLLHGSLRRVTALRDDYQRPMPPIASIVELTEFIQRDNREFMAGMRRISPRILIEQISIYDPQLVALFAAKDPSAPGLGVAWAGEQTSLNWFDIAREYTEKWHHQQQLRDATGRPALYAPDLFAPVLETFARGLPFAYRDHAPADGARIAISTTGPVERAWTLRRTDGAWSLFSGRDADAATAIAIPSDAAWRLWTKGLAPDAARAQIRVEGDPADAGPLLGFVAIMA